MQREFLVSVLVHVGILAGGLVYVATPVEDAPSIGSVQVELIASTMITTNTTETIDSDATEDAVAQGAEPVEAIVLPDSAETIEAAEPELVEVREVAEPVASEPVAAIETDAPIVLAALSADITETVMATAAMLEPEAPPETPEPVESIEPVEVADAKVAPVPAALSFTRPTAPTARPEAQRPRQSAPKPQQAGNGGNAEANVAAATSASGQGGAGAGGDADVDRYPSQIQTKLRRALRYPRDGRSASGEAQVYFVVDAGGQVSRLSIARSSGFPVIDEAALETVRRASPFPPIPIGAGRNVWEFTIPLAFGR